MRIRGSHTERSGTEAPPSGEWPSVSARNNLPHATIAKDIEASQKTYGKLHATLNVPSRHWSESPHLPYHLKNSTQKTAKATNTSSEGVLPIASIDADEALPHETAKGHPQLVKTLEQFRDEADVENAIAVANDKFPTEVSKSLEAMEEGERWSRNKFYVDRFQSERVGRLLDENLRKIDSQALNQQREYFLRKHQELPRYRQPATFGLGMDETESSVAAMHVPVMDAVGRSGYPTGKHPNVEEAALSDPTSDVVDDLINLLQSRTSSRTAAQAVSRDKNVIGYKIQESPHPVSTFDERRFVPNVPTHNYRSSSASTVENMPLPADVTISSSIGKHGWQSDTVNSILDKASKTKGLFSAPFKDSMNRQGFDQSRVLSDDLLCDINLHDNHCPCISCEDNHEECRIQTRAQLARALRTENRQSIKVDKSDQNDGDLCSQAAGLGEQLDMGHVSSNLCTLGGVPIVAEGFVPSVEGPVWKMDDNWDSLLPIASLDNVKDFFSWEVQDDPDKIGTHSAETYLRAGPTADEASQNNFSGNSSGPNAWQANVTAWNNDLTPGEHQSSDQPEDKSAAMSSWNTKKPLKVSYRATIEYDGKVVEIPLHESDITGSQKKIIVTKMPDMWGYIRKHKLEARFDLQDAYYLAKYWNRPDNELRVPINEQDKTASEMDDGDGYWSVGKAFSFPTVCAYCGGSGHDYAGCPAR